MVMNETNSVFEFWFFSKCYIQKIIETRVLWKKVIKTKNESFEFDDFLLNGPRDISSGDSFKVVSDRLFRGGPENVLNVEVLNQRTRLLAEGINLL